jgi:hypothetical protein
VPAVGAQQRIAHVDGATVPRLDDPVQHHVHRSQPGGAVDEFGAVDEARAQPLAVLRRQRPVSGVPVGLEQEATGTACRVGHGVGGRRPDAVDHRLDQGARGEVLAGAALDVLGALGQQFLVRVTLDVDAGRRPVLLADQVDDEPLELGRVLHLVLRLAEDDAEDALLPAQPREDLAVEDLELVTVGVQQPLPRALRRHDAFRLDRPGLTLVRHLEEQQVGELLDVVDGRDTVVAQDVAVGPKLVDQAAGVGHGT